MKAILILLVMLLMGATSCERRQEEVALPRTDTIEVKVTVPVKCVRPEDIAPVPKTAMRKDGDVMQNAAGAVIDAKTYRALAERQAALLQNCVQP
jgi:hypothetical protein